jgi:hypothetical protein
MGEVASFACAAAKTRSASYSIVYEVATAATLATGSFFGAVSHSAVPLRRDRFAPHKSRMSCKSFRSIHRKVVEGRFYVT